MNIKPYILATAVAVAMSQADVAKTETPTARQDFINLCADCHNADARGNGPLTKNLTKTPPDLTRIKQSFVTLLTGIYHPRIPYPPSSSEGRPALEPTSASAASA